MAVTQPRSGITELTISTGTGSLVLTGAKPGLLGLTSTDNALTYHYGIYQGGIAFEVGIGTYTHATRTFTRDTPLLNKNGAAAAYNFLDGTKELSVVCPAERTSMLDVPGRRTADYYFGGYRRYLDADEDSWDECATDDVYKLWLNSTQVYQASGGLGSFIHIGTDSTATEGPEITKRRESGSAANNDAGPVDRDQMRDAGGNLISVYKRRSVMLSATAGAHTSYVEFNCAKAGALQTTFVMRPDLLSVQSGVSVMTASKTTPSTSTAGAELRATGECLGVVDGNPAVLAYRNTSDGRVVEVGRAGAATGGLTSIAGTVAVDPFTGMHWSDWKDGTGGPEFETLGTVVSTAEGDLGIPNEPAVLCRPAQGPDDRRVYGVVAARVIVKIGFEDRDLLGIFAVGNGHIKVQGEVSGGDFLRASPTPGVAEAVPTNQNLTIGGMACIVAKATQDSPDDGGVRLVPCVYMAG